MFRAGAGEGAHPSASAGAAVDAGGVAVVDVGSASAFVVEVAGAARAPSSEPPHDTTPMAAMASRATPATARQTRRDVELVGSIGFVMRALDNLRVKLSSSADHSSVIDEAS
jgi:hypothetical protein